MGKPNPENIINLHYDYNRWVRQDVFDVEGKRTTRHLTYVWTPEDEILKTLDREVHKGKAAKYAKKNLTRLISE